MCENSSRKLLHVTRHTCAFFCRSGTFWMQAKTQQRVRCSDDLTQNCFLRESSDATSWHWKNTGNYIVIFWVLFFIERKSPFCGRYVLTAWLCAFTILSLFHFYLFILSFIRSGEYLLCSPTPQWKPGWYSTSDPPWYLANRHIRPACWSYNTVYQWSLIYNTRSLSEPMDGEQPSRR